MNYNVEKILVGAEGRYLSKMEQQNLREYVGSLEARLKAMGEVESKERDIIGDALRRTMQTYPDLREKYKEPEKKGQEDYTLVLRYAVLAMVRNDTRYLDEVLLVWFNTILSGLGFSQEFVRDAYVHLGESVKTRVSAETWALVEPFLLHVVQRLSERRGAA